MTIKTDLNRVMFVNSLARRQVESTWQHNRVARALLFGTDCQHVMPINLVQKRFVDELETVDDLDVTKWLSTPLDLETGVRADCLDDRTLEVDRFPFDSKYQLPAAYTIMWSHEASGFYSSNRKHCPNSSIPKVTNYKLHWNKGNIIVMKHRLGPFHYILDIEEADLSLVIAIVASAIETGRMSDRR
ncbi:hypothetical protein GALMADRAFT_225845 [Galerina marginata CBS 339.88]|uniref:Uncharacterized protein n=1 Tax=Galerina marginata (strain CBS 339.88) TaxID=685588 RepID=A0A067T8C3_GALM3|nr:hypothetical protein GALMADRAFT_225845 [Galerina marginata CBS 339.88]